MDQRLGKEYILVLSKLLNIIDVVIPVQLAQAVKYRLGHDAFPADAAAALRCKTSVEPAVGGFPIGKGLQLLYTGGFAAGAVAGQCIRGASQGGK